MVSKFVVGMFDGFYLMLIVQRVATGRYALSTKHLGVSVLGAYVRLVLVGSCIFHG